GKTNKKRSSSLYRCRGVLQSSPYLRACLLLSLTTVPASRGRVGLGQTPRCRSSGQKVDSARVGLGGIRVRTRFELSSDSMLTSCSWPLPVQSFHPPCVRLPSAHDSNDRHTAKTSHGPCRHPSNRNRPLRVSRRPACEGGTLLLSCQRASQLGIYHALSAPEAGALGIKHRPRQGPTLVISVAGGENAAGGQCSLTGLLCLVLQLAGKAVLDCLVFLVAQLAPLVQLVERRHDLVRARAVVKNHV